MKKIYYKVVSRCLQSSIMNPHFFGPETKPFCVKYKVNKYVTARPNMAKLGYHLLVFETKTSARMFAKTNVITGKIFPCYCKEEVELPKILSVYQIEQLLETKKVPRTGRINTWPHGTHMFKKVKILSKEEKI